MSSEMWDERYSANELVWSSTPNQQVAKFASALSPGTVLDFAGGEGRNALWLTEQGWDATVLDFSQVGLDRAQHLAASRLTPSQQARFHTIRADAAIESVLPESFDLVIVAYLQLAPDQRRSAMRTAARAVREDGYLFVIAHDSANLLAGYGGPQDPTVLYAADDVADDLSESGLDVIRADAVERTVDVQGVDRTAIDALLIARRQPVV